MLVRVKKTIGTYGLPVGKSVRPVTHASGPFEVTEEKAQELIRRGIVDVVEELPAALPSAHLDAPTAPSTVLVPEPEEVDLATLTIKELRALATERGVKWTATTRKADLIAALQA